MSENLGLVRSIYADWERGEWGSGDWADPGIEYLSGDSAESESVTGIAVMESSWTRFLEAWQELRPEAEEFRELDHGQVLVEA
jgi:hypothetical protein